MNKCISIQEVQKRFRDGMTIMCGGFLGVGSPERLLRELMSHGVKDLTVISNDSAYPESGIGQLIAAKRVVRLIASHIGTNPETGRQMLAGELAVELVPQGTLAERIRCGGAGLGGILTETGIGTLVEEGKTKLSFHGVTYLVELPLRGDIALIKAKRADRAGNLVYEKSARNFNPLMALAADVVIVEVDEVVEIGEIDPETVVTPGVVIDNIIVVERY